MVRRSLLAAALCAAVGAALYLGVVYVAFLQTADVRTLSGFMGLWTPRRGEIANALVGLFNPGSYAILAGALLAAAAIARRVRPAAVAFAAMAGANITTQLLKPALATQRDFPAGHYMGPEAWPSGHTTAAMSLALALVIVTPLRWRALAAAFGGLATIAVVFSILVVGAHYPSDIAGGFLVATGWACLTAPLLRPEARPSVAAWALGPALGAVVLLAAVLLRPEQAVDYAQANTTFAAGALVLAAGALVLSGSVPAPTGSRRRADSPRARG
jgi:membrane-associated phospholipid phosphatase